MPNAKQKEPSKLTRKYHTIRKCVIYCDVNDINEAHINLEKNGYKNIVVETTTEGTRKLTGEKKI